MYFFDVFFLLIIDFFLHFMLNSKFKNFAKKIKI